MIRFGKPVHMKRSDYSFEKLATQKKFYKGMYCDLEQILSSQQHMASRFYQSLFSNGVHLVSKWAEKS